MILRDKKGRENIVSRFVHDLLAWLGDLIVRLLISACIFLFLILVFAWLVDTSSAVGQARTPLPVLPAFATGEASCNPYRAC